MITTKRKKISDYLEYPEYERLLTMLRKDKNYAFELYARISFFTACRASDVLDLKWEDVLGQNIMTIIEKKTGKPRTIKINKSVQSKLYELYSLCDSPDKSKYIFKTSKSKGAMTIQYLNRRLKVLKVKYNLNINNFSTHSFRKTFGRYVYETNNKSAESLILLNKILNHANLETTKIYIGISQEEINKVYDSIKF